MPAAKRQFGEAGPGFAKRADNFHRVCEQAKAWSWQPGQTVARISSAVLKGALDLTTSQRMALLLYVEHLNQERLERDVACVWPSSGLISRYLGCSERQARNIRKTLEARGYMVRDYTRANRPAGIEAYDLSPTVARMEELESNDDLLREEYQAMRAAQFETVVGIHGPAQFVHKTSAPAVIDFPHEQSTLNYQKTVPGKDAPLARHGLHGRRLTGDEACTNETAKPTERPDGVAASAECSPEGASGSFGGQSEASVTAEMVRKELEMAREACPALIPALSPPLLLDPTSASVEDRDRFAELADSLLPESERNNRKTALWAWRRHGARAIAMLALALSDKNVSNPCKYFGWMAIQDSKGAPDLRLNFIRVLAAAKAGADPASGVPSPALAPTVAQPTVVVPPPGADDPVWQNICRHLPKIIGDGPYGSWFSRVGFHGLEDGMIMLSTPSRTAADRIRRDFTPGIVRAGTIAGVVIDKVNLVLRPNNGG